MHLPLAVDGYDSGCANFLHCVIKLLLLIWISSDMVDVNIEELRAKRICYTCVGENYLSNSIEATGKKLKCSYCGKSKKSWVMREFSASIELAFQDHFERTSPDPDGFAWAMMKDPESDYDWERDGEQTIDVISEAADVNEEVAKDTQRILHSEYGTYGSDYTGEEEEFDRNAHYEVKMPCDSSWQELWNSFERSLKTETRFFSKQCTDQLSQIFADIESFRTTDNQAVVLHVVPGDENSNFFRARVFQSDSELEEALKRPDLSLSPPPSRLARAGRMNARGVSVFYGASTSSGALAEVRPSVGSSAIVAEFRLLRPVKLLNLLALQKVKIDGSIFDPSYAEACSRMMFIRTLTNRIARPILPGDEDFDYLPTQAVADFLANSGFFDLDGILFPSVQTDADSINVVLFHKSSKVQELDIPKGTEISARLHQDTEDGLEIDYSVTEEVPKLEQPLKSNQKIKHRFLALEWETIYNTDFDERESTLEVDQDNLSVHQINSVKIISSEYAVKRRRYERVQLGAGTKNQADEFPF